MRWAAVLAILAWGGDALAYHEVVSFERSANRGGASGLYATGSPRFRGYTCALCHEGGEGRISVAVTSDPAELLAENRYTPAVTYTIRVELIGEHRGLESAFNPNTFTAEILDRSGAAAGALGLSGDPVVELADGGRIAVAEGFGRGETSWSFAWSAPNDIGPLDVYLALLDGDGASDPVVRFIDPFNDDVATFSAVVCAAPPCDERPVAPEPSSPAGCSSGGGGGSAWMIALLLAALRRRESSDSEPGSRYVGASRG